MALGEELMMTAPTQPRSANPGQEGVASMRITYGAVLPLAADEAFAFVADPLNWPLFFPGRQAAAKDDDWGRVGGHARLTSIILGRPMTMDVELTEWDPPNAFRYTVSREGGPANDDNRRTFQPVPQGTRPIGTTEIPTRPGPAGLLDRLQMALVRRIFVTAMTRLPRAAATGTAARRRVARRTGGDTTVRAVDEETA